MDDQPRITDLIPSKYSTFALWFLLGLTILVGLEALYAWMPSIARHTSDGRVAAFDLDGEGSLGAWFSSVTLLIASAVSLVVYSIRRRQPDDYHGRYRVWLWAAACWAVMSLDESASLHEGFMALMAHATGSKLMGDGSLWWVLAYLGLLGYVGVRLYFEMKAWWPSTTALGLAAASYAAAVIAQLGWIMPETGARGVMVEEGLEMLGNLLVVLAMGLHARYAQLAAQGLIPIREKKPKPAAEPKIKSGDSPGATEKLARAAATTSQAAGASSQAAPRPLSTQLLARQGGSAPLERRLDRSDVASSPHRLSKAERRALRKQHRDRDDEDDEE